MDKTILIELLSQEREIFTCEKICCLIAYKLLPVLLCETKPVSPLKQ